MEVGLSAWFQNWQTDLNFYRIIRPRLNTHGKNILIFEKWRAKPFRKVLGRFNNRRPQIVAHDHFLSDCRHFAFLLSLLMHQTFIKGDNINTEVFVLFSIIPFEFFIPILFCFFTIIVKLMLWKTKIIKLLSPNWIDNRVSSLLNQQF